MKKLLLLSFSALLFAACGSKAQPVVSESILWKVSGNGLESPSYLLGTHHFAPLSVLDNYPGYSQALESAVTVVGEINMGETAELQAMMMQAGVMPSGVTYLDLYNTEELERLNLKLREYFGSGLEQFGKFKPAMLSNMYAVVSYMKANPTFNAMMHVPIDTYVQNIAMEQDKQVLGLETIEEQIYVLLEMEPLDVQANLLLCALENDETVEEDLKKLDRLYKEGDLQGMYDMGFNNPDNPCPSSEEFELAINKMRNDKWMTKIPGIMAEGPAFIAVGALHLAGEEGLINQLRQLGYTVEPIK